MWVPYYGSGLGASDPYWFRSCIFPASRVGWDARNKELDYALLQRMIAEFRQVQPFLLGDYYPLTPYSLEETAWIAWQFHEPELGGGIVQAFRREECAAETCVLQLQGLDPTAEYTVENLDDGAFERRTGQQLASEGLRIAVTPRPGAALFIYRKAE